MLKFCCYTKKWNLNLLYYNSYNCLRLNLEQKCTCSEERTLTYWARFFIGSMTVTQFDLSEVKLIAEYYADTK